MKKLVKVLAIMLCLVMAVSAFAACSQPDNPDPSPSGSTEKKLTDGMFYFMFSTEGRSFHHYVHFYDNGMFYFSDLNGNSKVIGTYEVVDGEKEVNYAATREDKINEVISTTTVPKTVNFKDMSGAQVGTAGWNPADGKLYGVVWEVGMKFSNTQVYEQQAADWAPDSEMGEETGVALFVYEDKADISCYVEINHNGTFVDMMGMMIEGTWTVDGNVYTLKDAESDDTAKLTVNGDTAEYVGYDGTTMTITLKEEEKKDEGGSSSGNGYSWSCESIPDNANSKNFKITMTGATTCNFDFYFMTDWSFQCTCTTEVVDGVNIITITDWTGCNGEARDDGSSAAQVWGMASNWAKWQLNSDGTMERAG